MDNKWIPSYKNKHINNNNNNTDDDIISELRCYLNQISIDNYTKISNKICDLQIISEDILKKFVYLIFEKSIKEPKFSKLYASLILRLQKTCVIGQENNFKLNFKYVFLIHIQSQFEQYSKNMDIKFENEEEEWKYHRKIEGIIGLVCSLYHLRLITGKIVRKYCLDHTLSMAEKNIKSDAPKSICNMIKDLKDDLDEMNLLNDEGNKYIERLEILKNDVKQYHGMRLFFLFEDAINVIKNPNIKSSPRIIN